MYIYISSRVQKDRSSNFWQGASPIKLKQSNIEGGVPKTKILVANLSRKFQFQKHEKIRF